MRPGVYTRSWTTRAGVNKTSHMVVRGSRVLDLREPTVGWRDMEWFETLPGRWAFKHEEEDEAVEVRL